MLMHVYTESGAHYVWDINGRTITREGGATTIRPTAWATVESVMRPARRCAWEFTGWPGEMRYEQFSPWCSDGTDTIRTSYVDRVEVEADGVTIEVDAPDVIRVPDKWWDRYQREVVALSAACDEHPASAICVYCGHDT